MIENIRKQRFFVTHKKKNTTSSLKDIVPLSLSLEIGNERNLKNIFATSILPKMTFNANKISSNITILVLSVLLLTKIVFVEGEGEGGSEESERHIHPSHSVLFASFTLTLGVVVYYILSRYLHWLPYTAIMFLVGVIMGLIASSEVLLFEGRKNFYINNTIVMWQGIDSEVLLLVFLPGLIFKDALAQNPYLFVMGYFQLFIFAFPNVLAGTYLTAAVANYILPYEWPFFLCLTFGAIMSATDPVAVSALLEEVGTSKLHHNHSNRAITLSKLPSTYEIAVTNDFFLLAVTISSVI